MLHKCRWNIEGNLSIMEGEIGNRLRDCNETESDTAF